MADQESVAATLAAAIIQARGTRTAAQAHILNSTGAAAGSPTEDADAVRLYLSVLNILKNQSP